MEIRWLQDFLTLAETGNFTRAAVLRHASQAAFSRRIQQLEAWLGAPLIDRSMYPTRLTPEGEMFRRTASEMLTQVADARAEIAGRPAQRADHVRLALPYALATSHLPGWWSNWTAGHPLTADLGLGNVHDLGDALMSGAADIMMCFESALQPVGLDSDQVEAITLGHDVMRPYASASFAAGRGFRWPATEQRPAPLLMYSPGVYFGRLVDLALKSADPLPATRVLASDMADVLRSMAETGLGIAWLPDRTAACGKELLTALPGDAWTIPLAIKAFRLRDNGNQAIRRLWDVMKRAEASGMA